MLAGLFVWILAAADVSDETISSMPLKKDSSSKTISPNLKTEMKSGRAIGPRNLSGRSDRRWDPRRIQKRAERL